MNDKELMIALLAGKKMTNQCWDNDMYVKLNEKGNLVDKDGKKAYVYLYDTENWKEYVEYVDFNTAMQHIAGGGRVMRKHWNYTIFCNNKKRGRLTLNDEFETSYYLLERQDIKAKDWILL